MNPSAVSKEESPEDQKNYITFLESIIQALGFMDQKKDFFLFSIMVNNEKELSYEELYCYKAISETYGNVKDQTKINLNQMYKIMNQDEFPVCDQTTLSQIKNQMSLLNQKLQNPDLPSDSNLRSKWQSELTFLRQYLLRSVNRSGKIRCFTNFSDQSRKKVICGINRSLKRISYKNLNLANYINSTLTFGVKVVTLNVNIEKKQLM